MVASSTSHFSFPILVQPERSLPLNNLTQSSPGSLVFGGWARAVTANTNSNRVRTGLFSSSQLQPDPGCDAIGEVLDAVQIRPFHHYASQRLGAGEADQHAAVVSERCFRRADLVGDGGNLIERLAVFHSDIHQELRIYVQFVDEVVQVAAA